MNAEVKETIDSLIAMAATEYYVQRRCQGDAPTVDMMKSGLDEVAYEKAVERDYLIADDMLDAAVPVLLTADGSEAYKNRLQLYDGPMV